ncbi:MAG: NnrU family protein [Pseudohongiellaceae bacterium]
MATLIIGLLVFLGVHSSRLFAPGWRAAQIERRGEMTWKMVYSLIAIAGLILIVIGYGQARMDPVVLWNAPVWGRHLALVLTLPVFILVLAAYVPGNGLKSRLGHPMLAGVKVWALAHLLANGTLADVLLFGGFLAWAVACFAVFRRRDRAAGVSRPAGTTRGNVITVAAGLVLWYVFVFYLHLWLFGVSPLP